MSPWGRWERPAGFAALPGSGGCDCHSRSAARRLVSFSQVSQERISGGGVGSSGWSYKVWVFMPFSFLDMGPPVEGASLQPLIEEQRQPASSPGCVLSVWFPFRHPPFCE